MVKAVLFAVALAASVSAQAAGSSPISSTCSGTLLAASNDPDAVTCLNIGGILAIATTPAGTSLLPKIDSWVTGLCGAPACQQATLTSFAANVTANCATEIQSFGGGGLDLNTYLVQFYPTARRIACLKDSAASGQFCVTEDLTTLEKSLGQPLSITSGLSFLTGSLNFDMTTISKDIACSSCSQAAFSIFQQEQAALITPTVQTAVQGQCGAAFTTGGIPSTITEGLSATAAKPKAAAMTVTSSIQLLSIVAAIAGVAVAF